MTRCTFPTELHRQETVLMAFPRPDGEFGEAWRKMLSPFVRIASSVAWNQPLLILCHDAEATKALFCEIRNITFLDDLPYPGSAVREYGPITIYQNGTRRFLDPQRSPVVKKLVEKGYLYGDYEEAPELPAMSEFLHDGEGRLLCRAGTNVSPSRLCAERFLEIQTPDPRPDRRLRFAPGGKLLHTPGEEPRELMEEEGLTPVALPAPSVESGASAASYLGYLVLNHALLVPAFGVPEDKEAAALLQRLYRGREIIPIRAERLLEKDLAIRDTALPLPAYYEF